MIDGAGKDLLDPLDVCACGDVRGDHDSAGCLCPACDCECFVERSAPEVYDGEPEPDISF